MKYLLHASLKTRLIWATGVSAVIAIVAAVLIVLTSVGGWKQAKIEADKWYLGGEKQRCESLFSNSLVSSSKPDCRRYFPPHGGALTYEQILDAEILDAAGVVHEDQSCLARYNQSRLLAIEALWVSGCPTYGRGWGGDLYKPPTLRVPELPTSLVDYAWANSDVRPIGLASLFVALSVYLMLGMTCVRTIAFEPHIGWKRLTIVAGVVFPLLAMYIAFVEYGADAVEQFGVFLTALIVVPACMTFGRKLFIWVYSGFVESGAQGKNTTHAQVERSASEFFREAVNSQSRTASTSPSIVIDGEPVADHEQREAILVLPLASPWRRFFARMIDLWLFALPVWLVAGVFLGNQISEHPYLSGIVLLPFYLLLEAATASTFGNSPGKALLAVHVTSLRGASLSFHQRYERLQRLYVFGLALGIPFVSLFPMIKQYQLVNSARPTSYDSGDFTVRAGEIGGGRKVVAGVVLFFLASIPGWINATYQ